MAITIVVNECTAAIPARCFLHQPSLGGHVAESPVPVVVVKRVLAVVADEQVFVTIVIVIADANTLSPSGTRETCLHGDISKGAIAIIFEEVTRGLLPLGKAFETPAVYQENIEPAIVVVVIERYATAFRLQQVFVFLYSAENCLRI